MISIRSLKSLAAIIENNQESLGLMMDMVPVPLFIKDRHGVYMECNQAFVSLLSISREEVIGRTVFDFWQKEEVEFFWAQDGKLLAEGGVQKYEASLTAATGDTYTVEFHKQAFYDEAGAVAGFVGAMIDITEKKALESTLAAYAVLDELTGLSNRRDGMSKLGALHEMSRANKSPYCIAMIDLDCFKKINDQYGHPVGDLILKAFADTVKSILRKQDSCFRYGGEEFVLMLPETELGDGFAIVEYLRKTWAAKQVALSDVEFIQSTISIGIAQYDASNISYMQLIQISDKALYLAKNGGKNCSVCIQADC